MEDNYCRFATYLTIFQNEVYIRHLPYSAHYSVVTIVDPLKLKNSTSIRCISVRVKIYDGEVIPLAELIKNGRQRQHWVETFGDPHKVGTRFIAGSNCFRFCMMHCNCVVSP